MHVHVCRAVRNYGSSSGHATRQSVTVAIHYHPTLSVRRAGVCACWLQLSVALLMLSQYLLTKRNFSTASSKVPSSPEQPHPSRRLISAVRAAQADSTVHMATVGLSMEVRRFCFSQREDNFARLCSLSHAAVRWQLFGCHPTFLMKQFRPKLQVEQDAQSVTKLSLRSS